MMGEQSRQDRPIIVAAAVGALVLLAFLSLPLMTGRLAVRDDPGGLYLPMHAFYSQCLARGESFAWWPEMFGGYFMSGEGEIGAYHPVHWLMYRWLPLQVAVQLEYVLPYVIALLGVACLLRRFVNAAGALAGGLFFAFSIKFLWNTAIPALSTIVAHIPWLLLATHCALTTSSATRRRLSGVAIALLVGSSMLCGFAQAMWFLLLSEAAFCAYMFLCGSRDWGGWATVVAGNLLGACMGAVQVLTMAAFLSASIRTVAGPDFQNIGALAPHCYAGMIAPYLLCGKVPGWGGAIYFGTVPLMLALWWLSCGMWNGLRPATPPDSGRRDLYRLTCFLTIFGVVTLWLTLGYSGKLYYLQTYLPVVGKLRGPERFHILTGLAIAMLAGLAIARLCAAVRKGEKLPRRGLVLPGLLVLSSFSLALWFDSKGLAVSTSSLSSKLYTAPISFALALLALAAAVRGFRAGIVLLVVLAAVDEGISGLGNPSLKYYWSPKQTKTWEEYLSDMIPPPKGHEGRLWDNRWDQDILALNGYRLLTGSIGGMDPLRRLDYTHVNSLRAGNVAWYRDAWNPDLETPGLTPSTGSDWRRVPNPLPRARMVSKVVTSTTPGADLPRVDVDQVALVSHPIDLPASQPGRATIVEERPGSIRIDVKAPRRQLLSLSESFDAGWQIEIDGRRAELERVNGDFMGCVVEGGEQRVNFTFRPPSLRWGMILSLIGAALCLGWLVCPWLFCASNKRPTGP